MWCLPICKIVTILKTWYQMNAHMPAFNATYSKLGLCRKTGTKKLHTPNCMHWSHWSPAAATSSSVRNLTPFVFEMPVSLAKQTAASVSRHHLPPRHGPATCPRCQNQGARKRDKNDSVIPAHKSLWSPQRQIIGGRHTRRTLRKTGAREGLCQVFRDERRQPREGDRGTRSSTARLKLQGTSRPTKHQVEGANIKIEMQLYLILHVNFEFINLVGKEQGTDERFLARKEQREGQGQRGFHFRWVTLVAFQETAGTRQGREHVIREGRLPPEKVLPLQSSIIK